MFRSGKIESVTRDAAEHTARRAEHDAHLAAESVAKVAAEASRGAKDHAEEHQASRHTDEHADQRGVAQAEIRQRTEREQHQGAHAQSGDQSGSKVEWGQYVGRTSARLRENKRETACERLAAEDDLRAPFSSSLVCQECS